MTSPDCNDCLDDEMDDVDARPPTSPASTVDVVAAPSYESPPPGVDFFVSGDGLKSRRCLDHNWFFSIILFSIYKIEWLRSFTPHPPPPPTDWTGADG